MKTVFPILAAAIFGLLAAFVHYKSEPGTRDYLAAPNRLEAGSTLDSFGALTMPASPDLSKQLIPIEEAERYEGLVLNRTIEESNLILRSDFSIPNEFAFESSGDIAVNISLAGIAFEPAFLSVGSEMQFVYEEPDSEPQTFGLTGKFRVLAIGKGTVAAQRSAEELPQTICLEASKSTFGDGPMQELLRLLQDDRVVALAFSKDPKQAASQAGGE